MQLAWKPDWEQSRRHFTDWWNREGLVVGMWGGVHAETPHEAAERPERVSPAEAVFYMDAAARALGIAPSTLYLKLKRYDLS